MILKAYSAGLAATLGVLTAPLMWETALGFAFLLLAGSAARLLWGGSGGSYGQAR